MSFARPTLLLVLPLAAVLSWGERFVVSAQVAEPAPAASETEPVALPDEAPPQNEAPPQETSPAPEETSSAPAQAVPEKVVPEEEMFGAEANPTGDPIGGGAGYSRIVTDGDFRVGTVEELLAALHTAQPGQVIYVKDDAQIDLTGHRRLFIPSGVTLASGRGHNGSPGGLLFTTEDKRTPPGKAERFYQFETLGINVRVTGLRLRGPDTGQRGRYEYLNSDGILGSQFGLEVDNCELWGWSFSAVCIRRALGCHVHHNYIHHCRRQGLGYGVMVGVGEALIEANRFNACRHAIAGTGAQRCAYEARYNHVLASASSHSFDMHGGFDRRDGTNIAGDWIKIHHNTFEAKHVPAVVIRGKPVQSAHIYNNWFHHTNPAAAVVQKHARGRVGVYRNQYGPKRLVRN